MAYLFIYLFIYVEIQSILTHHKIILFVYKGLRMVAKGLPADLKPLADVLGVDEEKVKTLYTDELTEFKYQILWR